jgi:hypothetical protein
VAALKERMERARLHASLAGVVDGATLSGQEEELKDQIERVSHVQLRAPLNEARQAECCHGTLCRRRQDIKPLFSD